MSSCSLSLVIAIAKPLQRTLFQVLERERDDRLRRAGREAVLRALDAMSERLTIIEQANRRLICPTPIEGR